MLTGPQIILTLKVLVVAVTLLLLASLVALACRRPRLHGQINTVFFILTLLTVAIFELLLQWIDVSATFDEAARQALRTHLWFAVPSAVLLPAMFISGTGYDHLPHRPGAIAQRWVTDIPHTPFRWYSGVVELPVLNEYTWRGAWQREAEFLALAKEDVSRIAQESEVAVLLTHTHGVGDNLDYARRLIGSVIAHVRENGLGDFATLGELIASGRIEQAVRGAGPDILAV